MMEPRSLKSIAESCAGRVIQGNGDLTVTHVGTDSRQVREGELFIAIEGDRFDGHRFAGEAVQRGAAGILANPERLPGLAGEAALLAVDDTRRALGQIAAHYRGGFSLPVVAVAGSNGKTGTKELIASVLKQELETLWSEASFNNNIGVPLTLLRLEDRHEAAVFEIGTNHPGELAGLIPMIQPRFGVLTSIGREHLEFFGSLEGVAEEEGALAELLPGSGCLFVNGDAPLIDRVIARSSASVVRCGFSTGNDWRAVAVSMDSEGAAFRVEGPNRDYAGEFRLGLLGKHQVSNALLALAVAERLGVSPEAVRRGLLECRPAPMRLELCRRGGRTFLNDAYNANADSVAAALETLAAMDVKGRRIAVLGRMAELGANAGAAHAEAGKRAGELGIDAVWAVGDQGATTAESARLAGVSDTRVFADASGICEVLKIESEPADLILLKASRAAALERVMMNL